MDVRYFQVASLNYCVNNLCPDAPNAWKWVHRIIAEDKASEKCFENCLAFQCSLVNWAMNVEGIALIAGVIFSIITITYYIKSTKSLGRNNTESLKNVSQEFNKAWRFAALATSCFAITFIASLFHGDKTTYCPFFPLSDIKYDHFIWIKLLMNGSIK